MKLECDLPILVSFIPPLFSNLAANHSSVFTIQTHTNTKQPLGWKWIDSQYLATMSRHLSVFILMLSLLPSAPAASPASAPSAAPLSNYSLHIDCGGHLNTTDAFHTDWLSDRFYSAGATSVVSEPLRFLHDQEKTLRYFPISSGYKNCYTFPSGSNPGRYFLRTFTVYDNFDGRSHSPSFDVSVEGTVVFSWRSPWLESISTSGAYSDLFFYHDEPDVHICFYSIATDSPVIGSLELTQIDTNAYPLDYDKNSSNYILVNYGRFSSGSEKWGPGFSNDSDIFGRSWQPDTEFRVKPIPTANTAPVKTISTIQTIANAERSPNYFPQKLYTTAVALSGNEGGVLEYELPVDAKLDYLLLLHFAEIDGSVTEAGQRVFDVLVNGENIGRVDVHKEVGGFAAYDWSFVVKSLSSTILRVSLNSVVGSPLICGLENYAIVPVDVKTVPEQVIAMKALKESLRVPDRMGWNGDPCAPTTWNAWEGITCHLTTNGTLVVSQIDLGSQGLKGYISDKIGLLTNLVSLNVSSNSMGGTIPGGLGQKSLVKLDLSKNKFTGYIPDSLSSASLQLVFLNDNLLEGQVPEAIYSVGVHGGYINLYGNKGLCGVPSLPNCSVIWGKHGLSTGAKVAIGLSCLVIFTIFLFGIYRYIRKRQNDYDFGLPPELLSLAAKRNRYQRQKSLMALEMESQHAKGFIPTYNA